MLLLAPVQKAMLQWAMDILRASDHSLLIRFGTAFSHKSQVPVFRAMALLQTTKIQGVSHFQAAASSILVFFDPVNRPANEVIIELKNLLQPGTGERPGTGKRPFTGFKTVEIPVCYDELFAPDLKDVSKLNRMKPNEVVERHTSQNYTVLFLGFMPGFAYLAGLDKKIVTPRLETPRAKVPMGSVGMAGPQTGIYPQESPGGWRLIGRTPLKMFDVTRDPLCLLGPGDSVKFFPISRADFENWGIL